MAVDRKGKGIASWDTKKLKLGLKKEEIIQLITYLQGLKIRSTSSSSTSVKEEANFRFELSLIAKWRS